jgi:protein-S-isoprenylcysteine O-methyltransferase Ste14
MATSIVLLVLGFAFNLASAFTSTFTRWWGTQRGRFATVLLRDVFGIPVWAAGFAYAATAISPQLSAPAALVTAVALCALAVGALIIIAALVALGWRSAAPSTTDTLVERGPYAHVRHPIHVGTLLEFIGLALLRPTEPVLLACATGVVWLILQSRLEERDLVKRMPGYREYMRRVPRFIPRLDLNG